MSAGSSSGTGFVSLVGAGPGDPELLTRKAARRLAEADAVFYDGLVPLAVLELAPQAQRFSVAKRVGGGGTPQESIHRLLVRAARRGKRVVRLKGGDPFVFGRGGEEALALAAAGIPFEVVPGISSAIAAPALAGIPVTHRGTAAGFVVVAGHSASSYRPILDGLAPSSATIVVLMGLAHRGELAGYLQGRGWAASTPAALVLAAGAPESYTWLGTLAELGEAVLPPELRGAPGTIVVGDVVELAQVIDQRGGHRARPYEESPTAALSRHQATLRAAKHQEPVAAISSGRRGGPSARPLRTANARSTP